MVLTEPDAGSDVGAGRTKAILQPDGSWHLEGVKRFITSAEHDLTDNIVHMVLARPEGPGIESRPGTKGLSLFIVPKFHFDPATGELGERNGAFVTGLEHKMGLKVSTTCELSFGIHGTPAVGYLLGDKHDGIAQMFQVIEYARMMVGTKAIATLSTGYLNALEYAKQRVQSADLTRANDKTAPRVTIIHHPDVRRILLKQKTYAEGLRAVYLYTAGWQDKIAGGELDPGGAQLGQARQRPAAAHRQGRRLGARLRESRARRCRSSAGPATPRTTRSSSTSGTPRSTPCTRAPRRSRPRTSSSARSSRTAGLRSPWWPVRSPPSSRPPCRRTPTAATRRNCCCSVQHLPMYRRWSAHWWATRWPRSQEPTAVYKVGEHAVSLLMSVGDLLIGYLLLRQAVVAQAALDDGASPKDTDFYAGKLAGRALVRPERTARVDRPSGHHRRCRQLADGGRGGGVLSSRSASRSSVTGIAWTGDGRSCCCAGPG